MLRHGNVRGLAVDIALFGQLLEDNQCMTVEGGCIELAEVDGDRAALTVRRELEFGGHALVGNLQRLAGLLIHERCMERILLAGDKTLVLHLVSDDGILASHQLMVTVGLVGRGGTDGTRGEFHRLSLVVLIAFARDDGNGSLIGSVLDAALEHDLEDHEVLGLAGQAVDNVIGVEGVVHVDGTGLLLRGELRCLVDKAGEEVFVLLGICLDLGEVDGSGRELLCVRPVDTVIGNIDLTGLVGLLDITDGACAAVCGGAAATLQTGELPSAVFLLGESLGVGLDSPSAVLVLGALGSIIGVGTVRVLHDGGTVAPVLVLNLDGVGV